MQTDRPATGVQAEAMHPAEDVHGAVQNPPAKPWASVSQVRPPPQSAVVRQASPSALDVPPGSTHPPLTHLCALGQSCATAQGIPESGQPARSDPARNRTPNLVTGPPVQPSLVTQRGVKHSDSLQLSDSP
jgi:hypothetical protein